MKIVKRLFVGMLIAAVLVSSVACGKDGETAANGNKNTIIKFWNGFTGPDGEYMQKIVDAFNEEHKEDKITVKMDKLPWDVLYQKLLTSSKSGTSPDLIAISVERMASLVEKNLLVELSDTDKLGIRGEDYIPQVWDAGVYEGKRYALPLDIHPVGLYYNKALLEKEGYSAPPKTWDEFLEMAKKMTKDLNGDGTPDQYGYVVPSMYSVTKDLFYSILLQKGGAFLDEDNTPVYDSKEGVESLQFLSDLVFKDKVSPKDVGAAGDAAMFKQGKSAFYFDGCWMLNEMTSIEGMEVGTAAMPASADGSDASFTGSHQFALLNNGDSSQKKDAIYKFIDYVNVNSLEWAKAGMVPARLDVLDSPEFKEIPYISDFVPMKENMAVVPQYQYFGEVYNQMGIAVSDAISGRKSAKEALETAVSDTKKIISEMK